MDLSAMSVSEIKKIFEKSSGDIDEAVLDSLSGDSRAGVRKLFELLGRRRSRYIKEKERLEGMYRYEMDLAARGITLVAGVDEAGRGPLAGPVVAAAVVLPGDVRIWGVNDSKQLPPARREELLAGIMQTAREWATGVSTVEEIKTLNIHGASLLAMRRALQNLPFTPAYVLVDGFPIPGLDLPQTAIIGGDGLSASVAAASILAKVTRDRIMDQYHCQYPRYGFNRHKGYATPDHISALRTYGPCPLHREDFAPVKDCRVTTG